MKPYKELALVLSIGTYFSVFGIDLPENFDVDFETAMEFTRTDPHEQIISLKRSEHPIVQLCRTLYQKNNLAILSPYKEPLIPKIIHLIWVGPHTPPDIYYACLESIHYYLPDWECKIWTDADIPELDLTYHYYYDDETNYGAKSDILRYELLYRFGGVYIDIDIELIQSLAILHHTYEFYCCLMPYDRISVINNCVIGSVPGHPIIKECLDSLKYHRTCPDVLSRTGPLHFQEAFYSVAKDLEACGEASRIIALPKSFFFPFKEGKEPSTLKEMQALIKPETFGIHYWAGSWVDESNLMHHRKVGKQLFKLCLQNAQTNPEPLVFALSEAEKK